ncbi:MAG: cyclic-di-AMP receptor [Oscillospiraceae bacterium]|nr:cyclic-di-AMP receptor [Oscillospiraceae bacterium]MCD8146442.1 cyclic-di-AMP receptor [Clostridiales bacterium]
MKLVIAIVNQEDVTPVVQALNQGGYASTQMSSRGSYLVSRNTTFLIGVDEERVEDVKQRIVQSVRRRERQMPQMPREHYGYPADDREQITVGGATIFVVDVEQFERV